MNLKQWIANQTELVKDFDFAGVIFLELYAINTSRAALESVIDPHSFEKSFESKSQVILCLEVLTLEHLEILHNWLSEQCCDILNFRLILIGQPGAADFWQELNQLLGRNSFQIIDILDIPFGVSTILSVAYARATEQIKAIKLYWQRELWYKDFDTHQPDFDRQPSYHALYLPGRNNNSIESGFAKQYLALECAMTKTCYVDQCYKLPEKLMLLYWVERINGWRSVLHYSKLSDAYDLLQQIPTRDIPDDQHIYNSSRSLYYQSFATVVRETAMQQPWACVGEKTLRAFYFGQAVITTSYHSQEYLSSRGFEFIPELQVPHYDSSNSFAYRAKMIGASLAMFDQNYTKKDLGMLLRKHQDLFRHNSDLARKLTYFVSE